MTKWFKCEKCRLGCCWRDRALERNNLLKETDGKTEVRNVLCPHIMGKTDFVLWCDDDISDAMNLIKKEENE